MNYDDLIKSLRGCADARIQIATGGKDPFCGPECVGFEMVPMCFDYMMKTAADAIEKLSKAVDRSKVIEKHKDDTVSDLQERLANLELDNNNLTGMLNEEHAKRLKAEQDCENLANRLMEERTMFRECRNELCMKCGRYITAHLGACDKCKWRKFQ